MVNRRNCRRRKQTGERRKIGRTDSLHVFFGKINKLSPEFGGSGVNFFYARRGGNDEIARKHDAQGFGENKTAARKGGKIAGGARKKLEAETGDKVVSSGNYLTEPESRKRLKK